MHCIVLEMKTQIDGGNGDYLPDGRDLTRDRKSSGTFQWVPFS